MIRVPLCDDQALVRAGLRLVLEAQDDIEIVGEAADGIEGVDATRALPPMSSTTPLRDGTAASC